MPLLLLVDGSSYLYRAFHALPDLRNKAGEPTGAIYGVLNMLRRLESDYKAEYKAVVFDAKGKTFRDDWYPEYKAHRPPMPDDLVQQIEPLHAAIKAAGWPLLMVDGVEADDVIGTLATNATADGIETLISTGDKDLTQLVSSHVRWYNTMSNELLDEAGVEAKFGVPPGKIVDYLALVGDTVDGVPGVAKCGPKTALKWLAQYGSLDEVVAHANEIGGVVGQNLRDHLGFLPLGKRLVTVACDLSNLPAPSTLTTTARDTATLRELYTRYQFRTWLGEIDGPEAAAAVPAREVSETPAAAPTAAIAVHYETVLSWPQFDAWLAKIEAAELTALDTETTSLDSFAARIVGISLSVTPGEACYIPLAHTAPGVADQLPREEVLARLKSWLESAAHKKVLQNAKYDQHVFANHGIALSGIAHDTMLQSYVIESDKGHDLGQLCTRHLGLATIAYEDLCGKGAKQITFDQVDIERAATYAAEDSDVTLRVHNVLHPQFASEPGLSRIYHEIEMPARQVIWQIERNGILIDSDVLSRQSHEMGQKIMALEAQAYELAGQPFNLASPKQLADILFEKQGLPVKKKTPSGGPSTDEEVLSELALDYPLPKLLLEHRSLSKLKGTYTDKLPRMVNPQTGRVHTHFSQAAVVTGRLASSDPNLQNIPVRSEEGRKIRTAFIAPAGSSIVSADYSQIELRIMAHLSGDERLLDAFAHGEDVHKATAGEIFGVTPLEVGPDQRRVAKSINFGLIYGMSAFGLARQLGLERSAAQTYIDRYFARYPGVARYMEEARESARQHGYVETAFGRRLWFPDIRSSNGNRRQGAERAAINAPMQGTAADLIKLAMIAVQNWLEKSALKSRLILQVHDELLLEVPDGELMDVRTHLPRLMGQVAELKVPLVVEVGVGPNWEAAH
uniref:DNA polymerase I n=1 Tax=Dechloromonas aromatica (strain RCB) TaxID=159087 RepID=Q47JQ9_DECAR